MGDILKFRKRDQQTAIEPVLMFGGDITFSEADALQLQLWLDDLEEASGGLVDTPIGKPAPKQLVSNGERFVWAPVHLPIHQLPGFRPFEGVTWMLTPAERADAHRRRRAASRLWFKEIFRRGR